MPKTVDIYKFPSVEEALKSATPYSSVKVDLLTIAIGPEHHDLCLIDDKKPFGPVGRISFNVVCSHIEKIGFSVKHLRVTVDHLVQNEVALKLKFKVSNIFYFRNHTI